MLNQAKNSEEKAKKAMVDAARLADELRAEQDHSTTQEKAKRCFESQIAELGQRLEDANEMASREGRNAMAKLESRIRELEIELPVEKQEPFSKSGGKTHEVAPELVEKAQQIYEELMAHKISVGDDPNTGEGV